MKQRLFVFTIMVFLGIFCPGHFLVSRAQAPAFQQLSGNDINDSSIIEVTRFNPAALSFLPIDRYMILSASYRNLNSNSLHLASEGDKQDEFRGEVTGFINKEKASAFGNVRYSKGTNLNTSWSDVSDNDKIGPYIVAEEVGGDLQFEEYFISGAVSKKHRFGTLGFSGQYRAYSAYKTKDPRTANIVSDVKLGTGIIFNLSKYLTGIALSGSFYYQNVDIYFAEPDRKEYFYFLYGFGLEQEKISATYSTFNMNYSGKGVELTAFITPSKSESGWFLSGEAKLFNVEAIFDDMVPGKYKNLNAKANAGYKICSGSDIHYFGAAFYQMTGKGTEQYYNTFLLDSTSTTTITRLISKNTKFNESKTMAYLTYNSELLSAGLLFSPGFNAGLIFSESSYKRTIYKQSLNKWFVESTCGMKWGMKNTDLRFKLSVGYSKTIDSEIIVPVNNEIAAGQMLPDYAFLSSSLLKGGLLLQYDYRSGSGKTISASTLCNVLKSESDHAFQFSLRLAYIL